MAETFDFTIPEDVTHFDETELPEPLRFGAFVSERVTDQGCGKDLATLYLAMDLRTTFKGKVAGDLVVLSKGEIELLQRVTETPSGPYNAAMCVHLRSFFDAIRGMGKAAK